MKTTFGVIVGNRGFFPDSLAEQGRQEILRVLEQNGYGAVCLNPGQTEFGTVETREDAKKCAALFTENADRIDGIIITLPNFGDERAAAESIRLADLGVPVLVQASPDDPERMDASGRRDSFCGKISVCSNLNQYGIPFTLTSRHTVSLDSEEFAGDLARFAAVCRVVAGMGSARVGAIGTRPAAFNTVRYSEKILEAHGIAVEPVDLSEILAGARALEDDDRRVVEKADAIRAYGGTEPEAEPHVVKMARLGVVLDDFIRENELDACAIQCWQSLEQNFGVVPCTLMSMMSNALVPSACEVDVGGALAMYALQLASGTPSALLDWNNNYGDDPDRCVCFHCSNIAAHFMEQPRVDYQTILAQAVGKECTYGTFVGRIRQGATTFARIMTDDTLGMIRAYTGQGEFTDERLETFGGYGVLHVERLQGLMQYICTNGFEHHVAVSLSRCADVLEEAFANYLGYQTYRHR